MKKYDIGIIGAGPAGYTAAISAGNLGKNVVLFEQDCVGGVCLNRGCIPTKSILHSSELYRQMSQSGSFGVYCEQVDYDWKSVVQNKNNIVERLRKGLNLAMKNAKVEVVNSKADIVDSNTIIASGIEYNCDFIICATGSRPKPIKGMEFDGEFILSSDDVLNLENLPQNILIVGSGAIGIEWARIMSNFGVEVTVVELAKNLLPLADIEVSKRVERIFKTEGIKYFTGVSVNKAQKGNAVLSDGQVLLPEKILVAVGREPNLVSKVEGVKYLGDVSGEIQLAHYAIRQALAQTCSLEFDKNLIPSIVYGTPEIAWVGKREQDLELDSYQKSLVLVSSLGKAQCDGQTDGFIKLITQDKKIVGAHIVSAQASSLLQQVLIAMQFEVDSDMLKQVCFAHPTYSEGIFEALLKC